MRDRFRSVDDVTQHFQHGCSFLMRSRVEHVQRVGVMVVHNRSAVAVTIFFLLRYLVVVNLKAIGVVPLVMLGVERLKVRRKTLIEPDICPIAPLYIVTKPMLAPLMCYQDRAGIVLVGAL